MKKGAPKWAMEIATSQDRQRAKDAYQNFTWQLTWPEGKSMRAWAKKQGWPAPGWLSDSRFINKMLESDENFALALRESGLQVLIPLEYYRLPDQELKKMDTWYEERKDMGVLGLRPVSWGILVEGLREIRRAIEAGVVIEIDGKKIKSVGSFLIWAHNQYYMLEEGYDSWYGDDNS
jgi:hypothetical protein